eukprot:CAMPEP_0206433654 /NCGR_PEP_ID=MMETSP0324_2-20121206/8657_1 /ASSEMBLY_ACC=CAM_ASM_000836 /TAXON_ID=2866 /ORGANISM="Crypthecodinium cohnii, Strain Seligo" /LENGTH=174 /DNA_ID=CAMNT_0053899951 /DNA_START=221 /DNA_END=742 /DNA_ORIENTATION=-
MVTVRELYSPELSQFAGPSLSHLSPRDAEAVLSVLQPRNRRPIDSLALPVRQVMDPSGSVVPWTSTDLAQRHAAVQDERNRVSQRLRSALEQQRAGAAPQRKLHGVLQLGNFPGLKTRTVLAGCPGHNPLPAVFPYPTPIPHEAPVLPKRPSLLSKSAQAGTRPSSKVPDEETW